MYIYTMLPCGNEHVDLLGNRTTTVHLDMDVPTPDAWTIDFEEFFASNRTGCPVTTY
jgi:hypothetical protein